MHWKSRLAATERKGNVNHESAVMPSLDSEYTVTPEQIAAYHQDGFVVLRQVLTPEEVAAFHARITRFVEQVMPQLQPLAARSTLPLTSTSTRTL